MHIFLEAWGGMCDLETLDHIFLTRFLTSRLYESTEQSHPNDPGYVLVQCSAWLEQSRVPDIRAKFGNSDLKKINKNAEVYKVTELVETLLSNWEVNIVMKVRNE